MRTNFVFCLFIMNNLLANDMLFEKVQLKQNLHQLQSGIIERNLV